MSDEHDLYCYCPACSVRKQKKASYWNHSKCKKRSVITEDALVGCKGNDASCKRTKFVDCYWKCRNHMNEFKPVNSEYMLAGLIKASSAISKVRDHYDHSVFDNILNALYEQMDDKFGH